MKIRLIKDNEVVVSREEYNELINRPSKRCEKECRYFIRAIMRHDAKYECKEFAGAYLVFISGDDSVYPIKNFDSSDIEYNRVCAEELVELLNQEQ